MGKDMPDRYRKKADACAEQARLSNDPKERDDLMMAALGYLWLAEIAARRSEVSTEER